MRKTQKQVTGLRKLRREHGMTQKRLAVLSGLTQQTVSDYEKGKRAPSFRAGHKIARALNVSMDEVAAAIDEQLQPEGQISSLQ